MQNTNQPYSLKSISSSTNRNGNSRQDAAPTTGSRTTIGTNRRSGILSRSARHSTNRCRSINDKKTPACHQHPGSDTQQDWGDLVASPLREISRQVTNALIKLEHKTLQEFPVPRIWLFFRKFSLRPAWRRDAPTFSMAYSH